MNHTQIEAMVLILIYFFFQASNLKEKPKKHNRHFIGHHIGGVGGVFPPVPKESHKKHFIEHSSNHYQINRNEVENSEDDKPKPANSTCVHENKIYRAGEMVIMSRKFIYSNI